MQSIDASNTGLEPKYGQSGLAVAHQEVRCAVRFPLTLPVQLFIGQEERATVTRNISASGLLFDSAGPLRVGQELRLSVRMAGAMLGTPHDVLVYCRGRVVRCSISQGRYQAAATIDDYEFVEQ